MASRPTPRHIVLAVARAGALGALTLIDPNRLSGARKHLYWLGAGALTSAESLAGDQEQIPGTRPALAVGITGATYGAQDLLARGDKWTMDFLARRGVRHPRRWMAVLTAVGSLAITLFEARRDSALQEARYVWDGQDPVAAEPLPEDVRDIVTGLLDTVDGWGVAELRAQLADARCRNSNGVIEFEIPDDAPTPLLESYTFPATGTFERDGRTHVIILDIDEGKLAWLSQLTEPSWEDGDPEPDWSWPAAATLSFAEGSA
ncbi:MAG: hypothetical protein GXX86_13965 [Propionibacterium sp.]|nr:hypothetical protein [Propionibacterium sp.]